jgi:hypothetical protein
MTGKDITTGEVSQMEEGELKISLKVIQANDGRIGIECNYNNASTQTLLEVIPYMIDVAFDGNEEHIKEVGKILPDVIDKYLELKNIDTNIAKANDEMDKIIKKLDKDKIQELIALEASKENANIEYIMKLTNELKNRRENERGRAEEKTTDSIK